ncbi:MULTISPECIES: GDSL-type esterase/lipase family protein [unclassified Kitasatospora]|uniref:GDSL-type esterase/lipase family protein n=1 Tax=unclassified Kitasatospora TaxID=2633591 RepID=UPI00053999EC|nr:MULTISPECIES: GDSL-type esterase/lipase family protein [unclassified Kitasatospora]
MTSTTTPDLTVAERLSAEHGRALTIGADCDLPDDLIIEIDTDAHLTIGDRVSIRRGSTIQVHRGATVAIGNDVAIGEHTFISAMTGIRLGDGCALSNMVDLHDHNHRERSAANVPTGQLVPWASGFEAAPIIIEPGATLSNKVTVTAGVRIGANSLIGANAVVSHSMAPDTVAAGVPASVRRHFDGAPASREDRRTLTIGFFGTSIMEHLEAFNTQMTTQANLPEIGAKVTVEGWHQRGWVHRLALSLRAAHAHVAFDVHNLGEGGATSRDIAAIVETDRATTGTDYDLTFLGCGINDVWRRFQGRLSEAVDLDEYTQHINTMLEQLTGYSRQVVVVSETPFGPVEAPGTVTEMNAELARYNEAARTAAAAHGTLFLDVWTPFTAVARHVPTDDATGGVWSDGVHLTELGDTVLLQQTERLLAEHRIINKLLDYPLLERDQALTAYGPLFARCRPNDS